MTIFATVHLRRTLVALAALACGVSIAHAQAPVDYSTVEIKATKVNATS